MRQLSKRTMDLSKQLALRIYDRKSYKRYDMIWFMMQWYKYMPFIQFQRFVSELQDIGGDKNCFVQATLLGDGAVSTTLGLERRPLTLCVAKRVDFSCSYNAQCTVQSLQIPPLHHQNALCAQVTVICQKQHYIKWCWHHQEDDWLSV